MFWNVLNTNVATLWAYRRYADYGTVVPTGMTGVALGLRGGMAGVTKRVV